MKKNMGNIDRGARILFAVLVGVLVFTNVITGMLAYILLGISGILVLTSFISFCPIYTIFGASSCPAKKAE